MLGVFIALTASLAWAGSSTILKYLSSRIDAISINTMRLWVGSVLLIALVFIFGRGTDIFQTPFIPLLLVAISGVLSNAAGDTVYIQALTYMDVSMAYPISQSTFPVLTLIVAIFFLNESFTWFNILGAALVLTGIFMIVRNNKPNTTKKITRKGVALALLSAVLWAGGAITLKIGLTKVDTFVAAAIRIVTSALLLSTLAFGRKSSDRTNLKNFSARNLAFVGIAGVLTYGIGAIGYVTALQLIGAGKTVFLSASAPVFLLPMSVLILKERISPLALVGVFVSVAGICLVAL